MLPDLDQAERIGEFWMVIARRRSALRRQDQQHLVGEVGSSRRLESQPQPGTPGKKVIAELLSCPLKGRLAIGRRWRGV